MSCRRIIDFLSCSCKSDYSKEEKSTELNSRRFTEPIKNVLFANISSNHKWQQKKLFSSSHLVFMIMCFLLPQDALNCGLFLASPHFFKHTYRREKFISQNKEKMKNFVKQIEQININPDTPNEVRYFMEEIQTFRYSDDQFCPHNCLNFLYKFKQEILINLQKMAKYFDKLMLKIECSSNFSNESGIYFLRLPTGKTLVMNLNFPKYVCICFKTFKISFCLYANLNQNLEDIFHRQSQELSQFTDGILCYSTNSFYKLRLQIADFKLKPVKLSSLETNLL